MRQLCATAVLAVLPVAAGITGCASNIDRGQADDEATTEALESRTLATAAWNDAQDTAEAATLEAMERESYDGPPTGAPTNTPYGWMTVTPGAYRDNPTLAPLPGGGKPTPNPAHTAVVVLELTEEPGEVVPVPTMSPDVLRQAYWCSSMRTAMQIQPGSIVSATYSDGIWTVETEGLWEYVPLQKGTAVPPPHVSPTDASEREPWQDARFVASCTMQFDAESGWLLQSNLQVVTATPPSR